MATDEQLVTGGGYKVSTSGNMSSGKAGAYIAQVTEVFLVFEKDDTGRPIVPGSILVQGSGPGRNVDTIIRPLDENFYGIPLITETVEIVTQSGVPYYRRFNFNSNLFSATDGETETSANDNATKVNPSTSLKDFKTDFQQTNSGKDVKKKIGEYFKIGKSRRLKLYEGDHVIQSRFGQSIRFSAFNNDKKSISPTIILRNGESPEFSSVDLNKEIEESINKDGSTIAMTSGDYTSKFNPSYITNKKEALEGYPSELKGNQIIITSDRLVFSTRTAETIFFSKGNYAIVTDGVFSVDTNLGITIESKGDIDISAVDKRTTLYIGDGGTINLGDKNIQPAVLGNALENILIEIITEIINLQAGGLLTPAGPTSGMNPANLNALKAIQNKLVTIKSKRVNVA
jgi:hypothetical protein